MRPVNVTRCDKRPYQFAPPFEGKDYALLLYIAAEDVSADEQATISQKIIDSGCRYAVCYGHNCSSWDDSVDMASVISGKEETEFVMTTWLDDEVPEDVVHFFWNNTWFDEFIAERMGVFIIGSNPPVETELMHEIVRANHTAQE